MKQGSPDHISIECQLRKVKLFLDLNKDRRIHTLQKLEASLRDKVQIPGITLNHLKEDLQICVGQYQKIKAISILTRQISFLQERSLLLEKGFRNQVDIQECHNVLRNVAWGLHRLNSNEAPEFMQFFGPLLGDLANLDRFIDRELFFLLGYVIPQDIEVIKYLKGFLDRNHIPIDKVKHMGWYGDSLDNHIQQLEKNEMNQSKMRSKINVAPKQLLPTVTPPSHSQTPGFPQHPGQLQPPASPQQPTYNIPVTPVVEATQAELGLETGEKYNDNFDNDLAFLKQDIQKTENDPKMSNFVSDIKRKEAINANALDLDFLRALQGLSTDPNQAGQHPHGGDGLAPPIPTEPGLSNLYTKTEINPSGFNPNPVYQSPAQNNGSFNMSGMGQPQSHPAQAQAQGTSPTGGFNMSGVSQTQNTQNSGSLGVTQVPGWAAPNHQAFASMIPNVNQPPAQADGFAKLDANMGVAFPTFPGHPAFHEKPQTDFKSTKPKLPDGDFIKLLKRVGV